MPYALGRVVSIWMGLYYNFPRIQRWSREEGVTPTIGEALDHLAEQRYRASEKTLYYKMRSMFRRLKEHNCKQAVSALESAWSTALKSKDVRFNEPIAAVSLYEFKRFYGASWPHNDIAVYLPDLKKTAVMKMGESRFEPLRQKLMALSQGMDPFIGTTFSIEHSKLHPVFNRVRCSKAMPISPKSFKNVGTFKNQLSSIQGAYILPAALKSLLEGNSELDLQRYIIARYSGGYALMQFITSDALLKSSTRHKDWNHTLKLDIDGLETYAWMSRDALFDPVADPIKYAGKNVRIGGFVLVGRSAIDDFRASVHVMSIAPADEVPAPEYVKNVSGIGLPPINQVEAELMALTEEMRRIKAEELEAEKEVQEALIAKETPKLRPQFSLVKESDLVPEEGRILVLVSSDRNRGFKSNEILTRLGHEGLKSSTAESVSKSLEELCKKEYLYMNIFGDAWYLNPALKVVRATVEVPPEAVEPRILEYLEKVYGDKIHRNEIIRKFCQEDSRLTPRAVSKALSRLLVARKILNKKNKYYWNPYPPKKKFIRKAEPKESAIPLLQLDESQVEKIPNLSYAHRSGVVNVYNEAGLAKKFFVYKFEDSPGAIKELIDDVKKGRYTSFDFMDHLGGRVKVWRKNNRLEGAYVNNNKESFSRIAKKFR